MLERHRHERTYPSLDVVEVLQLYFRRPYGSEGETWHTRLTSIRRDGTCDACEQKLEPLEISQEQFEELRRQLLEKVIKGTDIYRQTTPDELESFLNFVNEGAPYNIIIDGLNVAYTCSKAAGYMRYKVLYDLVAHLVHDHGLKCLVLGRHHMTNKHRGSYIQKMTALADCFFAQNVSEDDPFMLYATLQSGPEARYITNDLLRDHKYLVDDDMKVAFERWQQSRQLKPKLNSMSKGRVAFQAIRPYDTVVQRTEQAWHIPYDDGTLQYSYDLPKRWLCAARLY
ncbi:mitochondrial ribonuclease P catalytic subunit-like [Amphiura filiformis]|uniref:mitochondrial ribonuclease P catalytic subunit-like n=1 Tax=Amphiura filiformis TaxID=82378 RepID=UPI003B224A91